MIGQVWECTNRAHLGEEITQWSYGWGVIEGNYKILFLGLLYDCSLILLAKVAVITNSAWTLAFHSICSF